MNKENIKNFGEFFEILLNKIEAKSKIPVEMILEFEVKPEGHSDFDELYQFRNTLGKLLKKIGLGLGHHEMYHFLRQKLMALVERSGNWSNIKDVVELENLLFMISFCIQLIDSHKEISVFEEGISLSLDITSKSIDNNEDQNKTNINYAALRRSVIDIIHVLSEFYNEFDHSSLKKILSYICEGFSNKMTRDISCQCFERMILQNIDKFKDFLGDFILYMKEFAQECDSYHILWGKSFTSVLTLACNVYKNSQDFFKEALQHLLMPFVDQLGDPEGTPKQAYICFEYMADMFSTIHSQIKYFSNIKDPAGETLISIWPLIFQYINNYSDEEKMFEANTRLVKNVFRGLNDKSGRLDDLAKQYIEKVVENFKVKPSSWLIYPIEVMIPLYVNNENFELALNIVIELLIGRTLEYIDSIEKMKSEVFLITDLFSGISKLIKESPEMLFKCKLLKNLINCSVLEIDFPGESTSDDNSRVLAEILNLQSCFSKKLCNFQRQLYGLIKDVQEGSLDINDFKQEFEDIATHTFSKGEAMFQRYVQILVQVPMKYVEESLVDIICSIIIEFPDQSIPWLQKAINERVPDDGLSESEKRDFCVDFQFGLDSMHTIHKSFSILTKRSKKCIARNFV